MRANKLIMIFILFGISLIFLSEGVDAVDFKLYEGEDTAACEDDTLFLLDVELQTQVVSVRVYGEVRPIQCGSSTEFNEMEVEVTKCDLDEQGEYAEFDIDYGELFYAGEPQGKVTLLNVNSEETHVSVDVDGFQETLARCDKDYYSNAEVYVKPIFLYHAEKASDRSAVMKVTDKREIAECTDSDGGNNLFVKGTCSDSFGEAEETCLSMTTVNEYSCQGDICIWMESACPQESECIDGACQYHTEFAPGTSSGNTALSTFLGLLIVAFIGGYWYYSKRKLRRKAKRRKR